MFLSYIRGILFYDQEYQRVHLADCDLDVQYIIPFFILRETQKNNRTTASGCLPPIILSCNHVWDFLSWRLKLAMVPLARLMTASLSPLLSLKTPMLKVMLGKRNGIIQEGTFTKLEPHFGVCLRRKDALGEHVPNRHAAFIVMGANDGE